MVLSNVSITSCREAPDAGSVSSSKWKLTGTASEETFPNVPSASKTQLSFGVGVVVSNLVDVTDAVGVVVVVIVVVVVGGGVSGVVALVVVSAGNAGQVRVPALCV